MENTPNFKVTETVQEHINGAIEVRTRAYAPYSHFKVGAAVVSGDRVFYGVNVENASFGATVCAERTAILTAVANQVTHFDYLIVVNELRGAVGFPCGMCRQVIAEFSKNLPIIMVNGDTREITGIYSSADLLPHSFELT